MKISVIICTHNRSGSLARTLHSFKELAGLESLSWELIIVDNNSRDQTRAVAESFHRYFAAHLKYVFEPEPGLSRARNRGIKNASGEILAFTDDDVVFDRDWLHHIQQAFGDYPVGCVGGKILPVWEIPKPPWLIPNLYSMLALLDLGNKPRYLTIPQIFGANFAVRAALFARYGDFQVNLGRRPDKLFGGEDTDFFLRVLDGGEKLLYYPDMLLYHCIPAERISKRYFRRWRYDAAASNLRFLQTVQHRSVWGVPDHGMITLLRAALLYLLAAASFSPKRFLYELRLITQLSFLVHRLRRAG